MFFEIATEKTNFLLKLSMEFIASLLLCLNIIFRKSIKAMMANSGSNEAMKR